jgi:NAD(P)-dependent dehydrogenase (short-subunit alcohol dehydrogenase family)
MSASRTVLLTGATRGLGRAMVDRLIEAGHVVLGCGRAQDAIEVLAKRYTAPHRFQVVDVANDAAVSQWAGELLGAGLVPDLVLNNAALMNDTRPLWEVPADEMARLLAVNVGGVANVIRHFVPAMIARGRGVIVNFSSGWGRSTAPEVAPYCATKYAVEGLTLALAQELPRGMAAIPLNPGCIDTDMLRQCWADDAGHYPKATDWSQRAVPFILHLGAQHNGRSLSVD